MRVFRVAVVVVITVLGLIPFTPARAGGYIPGCAGYTKTWSVKDGSVWIVIGHVNAYVRRCWNAAGALTGATASTYTTLTNPGYIAGWHLHTHADQEITSNGASARFTAAGDANLCVAFRLTLCGRTEDFTVSSRVWAPNQYGPYPPTFAIGCANKACKLKFG